MEGEAVSRQHPVVNLLVFEFNLVLVGRVNRDRLQSDTASLFNSFQEN